MDELTHIARLSKTKKENNKKDIPERPFSKVELCEKMPAVMDGRPTEIESIRAETRFDHKFHCVMPSKSGEYLIFEVTDGGIVKEVDLSHVANCISKWRMKIADLHWGWKYANLADHGNCVSVAKAWRSVQVPSEEVPDSFKFKSDPGLCFQRLPFDIDPCDSLDGAPTWAGVLARMHNGEAFAMRVASLFHKDAQRRQAIWLWGVPKCGKSSIVEVLMRVFGRDRAGTKFDKMSGEFWKSPLVGKRLACVDECDPEILSLREFKSITGDNYHLVNEKREKMVTQRIDAIFLFTSNDPPLIPNDDAIISRVIPCHLEIIELSKRGKNKQIEQLLWNELPVFLGYGWKKYFENMDDSGFIPCDHSKLMNFVEQHESDERDFLARFFVTEKAGRVLKSQIDDCLREANMWQYLNMHKKRELNKFLAKHGVHFKRMKVKGQGARWGYEGIRLRVSDAEKIVIFE